MTEESKSIKYCSERQRVVYGDGTELPPTEALSKEDSLKRELEHRIYASLEERKGVKESLAVYGDWCQEQEVTVDYRVHYRDLRGEDLSGLYLPRVSFFGCRLERVSFERTNLEGALFSHSRGLGLVRWVLSDLTNAMFCGCPNLDEERLSDAILLNTKITGMRHELDQLRSSLKDMGIQVRTVRTEVEELEVSHRAPTLRRHP